jgi:hypothetical protein
MRDGYACVDVLSDMRAHMHSPLSPKSAALAVALSGESIDADDDDATALGYVSDGDGTPES